MFLQPNYRIPILFIYFKIQLNLQGRGNVTLTNGQQGFVRWFPGYPTSTSGHSRLCVVIEIQPGRGNNIGFFNINPEHTDATVPLCQFNVE